jgi:hypothetical protein
MPSNTKPMPESPRRAIQPGSDVEKHALSGTYNLRQALEAETVDDAYGFLLLAINDIREAATEVKKSRREQVTMREYEQVRFTLITEGVQPMSEEEG